MLQAPVLTEADRLVCGVLKAMAILCAVLGVKAGLDIAVVVEPELALRLSSAFIGFCLLNGIRMAWRWRATRRASGQLAIERRPIGFRGTGPGEEARALKPPSQRTSRAFRERIGFATEK